MSVGDYASGLRVQGRVRGLWLEVQGLGFRVYGLGFKVQDLGVRI